MCKHSEYFCWLGPVSISYYENETLSSGGYIQVSYYLAHVSYIDDRLHIPYSNYDFVEPPIKFWKHYGIKTWKGNDVLVEH